MTLFNFRIARNPFTIGAADSIEGDYRDLEGCRHQSTRSDCTSKLIRKHLADTPGSMRPMYSQPFALDRIQQQFVGFKCSLPSLAQHSASAFLPTVEKLDLMLATRVRRLGLGFALAILVIVSLMTVSGIPSAVRPHVYWLPWSQRYKQAVLSSSAADHQLLHVEWDGDAWGGGTPVGDWTGYVVYDPRDSLQKKSTSEPPGMIIGVPCEVVAVRRLEPKWYSVVTVQLIRQSPARPGCCCE